ncbi:MULTISPECIES: EAL domain-containing protein [Pseudoalteromonas]|uniref:EAL domain-containing protein n=1 Tax=Pseudoalteromonas TaxID=53246 RepID=UPI00201269D8|nr:MULTISPECIES: EAL domain-containing protein [Pseudoalteromonas]
MRRIFLVVGILLSLTMLMADKLGLFLLLPITFIAISALVFLFVALLWWQVQDTKKIMVDDGSSVPQMVLDSDGVILQANEQMQSILGVGSSVIGLKLENLIAVSGNIHSEGKSGAISMFEALVMQSYGNCTTKHSGKVITPVALPIKVADTVTGYLCYFNTSSRENRLAQALEEEKELLEVTLSSIGDGVICTDVNGVITYINPVTEAILAMLNEEVVGRRFDDVMSMYHEETKASVNKFPELCLKQGHTICLPELTSITNHLGLTFAIQDSFSPIIAKDGSYLGTVMVFQDVTESRLMAKKMNHLAHHDALTGLPNRLLLHDRLVQACKRAKRMSHQFALVFIDVNKFKKINDSLGHDYGDLLLKEIASRLTQQIRGCDTVARMGGDEFVLLIDGIQDKKYVRKVVSKVLSSVNGQYCLRQVSLKATVSAGVAIYPDDGDNTEALLKHADTAMYRAKKATQTEFQFYNARLDHESEQRLVQESRIIQGLDNREFIPYYQPIVDAHTRKIKKLEVLARWQQDEQLLVPEDFFEAACDGDLMVEIGQQLRTQAFQAMKTWFYEYDNLVVSFNFSLAELTNKTVIKNFMEQAAQHQLPSRQIEIEIKEVDLIELLDKAPEVMAELEQTGMRISIDHFGVGHTSMLYLQKLTFETIKIPPAFLATPQSVASQNDIAKLIVQMAKSLDVECVAVGVETALQAKSLNLNGCHLIQGNHLFAPATESEITPILSIHMSVERRRLGQN